MEPPEIWSEKTRLSPPPRAEAIGPIGPHETFDTAMGYPGDGGDLWSDGSEDLDLTGTDRIGPKNVAEANSNELQNPDEHNVFRGGLR